MFSSLSSDFDKQIELIDECFSLWQRSKSSQLTATIKMTLSKVCRYFCFYFHLLNFSKNFILFYYYYLF